MGIIHIENAGPELVATNYWQTEHAAQGLLYVSLNAGTFRLLVPASKEGEIPEMLTGQEAIVSRGPWDAAGGREALEIMFEDGSDAPYSVHLLTEQVDRLPSAADEGRTFVLSIWTEGGKQAQLPAKYRRAKRLPWLRPWAQAKA